MRILIFGATGMLGHVLFTRLSRSFDVAASIRGDFASVERFGLFERERIIENIDVSNEESVLRAIDDARPDCVINSVGVIKQAPELKDPLITLGVNSVFPQRLLRLSGDLGFKLITLSTDCVFSGKRGNYSEKDVPDATDLYGISKFLGEVSSPNALTIRTSMIGRELTTGASLVQWFLAHRGSTVNGYPNAVFSGFPTIFLADIIAGIIADHPGMSGVYHISSDPIDKFTLLGMLNRHYDAGINIIRDESFVIDRSLDSSRFREETGFRPVPWSDMVAAMAADPTSYDRIHEGSSV